MTPDSLDLPLLLATAIAAYLLGSIPFGLVLTRLAGLGDIRTIGSGNIGATNVLRTGNRALAAATLLLDGGKGAVAVLLGRHFGPEVAALAGASALVRDLAPVWLRCKGGKGVATGLGVLLAASVFTGVAACASWILVALLTRYSSLAALVAFALAPLFAWLQGDVPTAWLATAMAVLVYLRHRANIRRLLGGTESKLGAKR